jgi:hypothetical protein
VAGFAVEKVVMKRLMTFVHKTQWKGDEIILSSLKGIPFLALAILGLNLAVKYLPIGIQHVKNLEKFFIVFLIFLGTAILAKISAGLIQMYSERVGTGPLSTTLFSNLSKILTYIIGLLTILHYLEISITP